MEASVVSDGQSAVIRLGGRFDFSAHREFRVAVDKALNPGEVRQVKVDLSDVGYLDSSALGMLLMLRDRARATNRPVALTNCKGSVKQILDIANFSKLFDMA